MECSNDKAFERKTMSGTRGEIDYAIRRAFNKFDAWNDVTGYVPKFSGYYYEIQAVIVDAVHCGFQRATDQEGPLPSDVGNEPVDL